MAEEGDTFSLSVWRVKMPVWLNILLRALVSFLAVFLFTRLIGKRQLSQITFFEYTVGIAIGDMAAIIADDIQDVWYKGVLPMFVYTALPIGLSILAMKSKVARNIVEGRARVLVKDGKIMEDNLKKERMSVDELLEQLRSRGAFQAADVEFALMESNGQVNVLLKSENQPLTAKSIGRPMAPVTAPQAVIMDGSMVDEGLAALGFNRRWLHAELEKQGVTVDNVFLGQVDGTGQLYVDLYDDKIQVPVPQTLKLTFVTLKKVQADLELYALSVENVEAKRDYARGAVILKSLLRRLQPFLDGAGSGL
jgi:uncharacterized membrane protein YcaP (DUF421 family)